MRISAVLEKVKTISKSELLVIIDTCEKALLENRRLPVGARVKQERARNLNRAIASLKAELQSRA